MIRDMTQGSPAKLIGLFAIPLFFGNLLQQTYNLIDSIIIGQFMDVNSLAAVGTSSPIILLFVSITVGIGIGVSIIIAQLYGAHRVNEVKKAVSTLLIWIFIFAIVFSIAGLLLCETILKLIKVPTEIHDQAAAYLRIIFGGYAFVVLFNFFAGLLRGLGDSRTPLITLFISTALNIGLDVLFVMVFQMGIPGVAIATIISQGLSATICFIYISKKIEILRFKKGEFVFDKDMATESLRISVPTAVLQAVGSIGTILIQSLVNSYGAIFIAAYFYAMRIDLFLELPVNSLCLALSVFVAQNIGAQKYERVGVGISATNMILVIISLIIYAAVPFIAKPVLMLMMADANLQIVEFAYQYLLIIAFSYVFYAIMNNYLSVLRAAGDTRMAMFLALIGGFLLREPLAYLLCSIEGIGSIGIAVSRAIAWIIACIFAIVRYHNKKWVNMDVLHYHANKFLKRHHTNAFYHSHK